MFGVFHQMFLLCRLREFYRRVAATGEPAEDDGLRNGVAVADRLEQIEKNLKASFSIVAAHAALTTRGEVLIREISSLEAVA